VRYSAAVTVVIRPLSHVISPGRSLSTLAFVLSEWDARWLVRAMITTIAGSAAEAARIERVSV
jgi:hypothetical protein